MLLAAGIVKETRFLDPRPIAHYLPSAKKPGKGYNLCYQRNVKETRFLAEARSHPGCNISQRSTN
ncbi:MAG: hypothetical protein AB4352_21080 [Hormoscilla sp.]